MRPCLQILFALVGLLAAAPAFTGESLEKTTVTFNNGETYEFVPHGITANGTIMLRGTRNGQPANIESFGGKKIVPSTEPDALNCFEIVYDKTTDLMQCTRKSSCCSWSIEYYRDEAATLKLIQAKTYYVDDENTPENEEKTVIDYEAGKQ